MGKLKDVKANLKKDYVIIVHTERKNPDGGKLYSSCHKSRLAAMEKRGWHEPGKAPKPEEAE